MGVKSREDAENQQAASYWIDPETGEVLDTLANIYGDIGPSDKSIIDSYRRDDETICVREWVYGVKGASDVICYKDKTAVWAPHLSLNHNATKLLVGSTLSGSAAPHMEVEFNYSVSRKYTVVDLESTKAYTLMEWKEGDAPYWTQWLPDGSGFLVLLNKKFYSISLDGRTKVEVFKRLNELRNYSQFMIHPTKNILALFGTTTQSPSMDKIRSVENIWDVVDESN